MTTDSGKKHEFVEYQAGPSMVGNQPPCANCERLEDQLYHESRKANEYEYKLGHDIELLTAENERLKERLKVACEYFEKINMQRMSMHLNMGSLATRCLELSGEALEQIGRE